MLSVENVSKFYGEHCALDSVSLHIPKACIYGLLGPNGAGKTSLIRIINQITAPDEGNIYFKGEELRPEHINAIGYLPEERGLYPKMKVGEHILYLARLKGLSKQEAKKRMKDWFERFEISSWSLKNIEELSKGMAQKVQFIATVIHQPELLIFDEPFTGFDPINTNLIKSEILRLREEGATVIFSTHRMDSVEEICDRITLINKSKKILEGEIENVKNEYKSNIYRIEIAQKNGSIEVPEFAELLEQEVKGEVRLLRVAMNDKGPNILIERLMAQGNIISFNEEIPSLNDIFIHKVEEQ